MEYRVLSRGEIDLMYRIDRSEVVEEIYYNQDGTLDLKQEFCDMPGFAPGELDKLVRRIYALYDEGGTVLGAFEGNTIAGIAALEVKFRGSDRDTMNLLALFVSKPYRRQGIGRWLVEGIAQKAWDMGATKLYISATPSRNTVQFYMGIGAQLASEIDPELFELEPLDIHLELDIRAPW
ncbi:MAG: GNAT family N-acetyltransferase [Chloroflexi bacterium]|uniref:GNAT family N-acetyltransferase n=1 Tax=Candidatus Chlorohelix allophototropha TaxID=3003348 RepID=A0A8T7M8D8_9CHLR|nr:GNAT family N-acetyltransferase [Chloroflexota bacterium]WJW68312.1 GNAT family N-acetyltransferase [Chloroflexota bacterium L227-S17]